MFTIKELKGKQIFRNIMPNILRRLSRSLSSERKRKNSCTQIQDENLILAIAAKTGPESVPQSAPGSERKSRKKSKCEESSSSDEKKERRRFWTRSTSASKRNRVQIKTNDSKDKATITNTLSPSKHLIDGKKWFKTKLIETDKPKANHKPAQILKPLVSHTIQNALEAKEAVDNKSDTSSSLKEVYCDVCGVLCEGETLKPSDKDIWIHLHCFNCAICGDHLNPSSYFEHCQKYLCAKDYHEFVSNFGHQRSTQQELHPDKFTAHNTLQNGRIDGVPDNTEFNLLNNTGSKNTVSYPTKPNSSTPVNPSALDCRKNLVSTCSQTLSSPALMTPANVTSSSQSPGSQLNQSMTSSMAEGGAMTSVCHICESPVSRSAGALLAMGRLLHNDCYICCKCGRQPKVGQEVAIESKKVFCCKATERIKTCQGCLKQIFQGEMTLSTGGGEKTWHRMCFRCSKCSILISDEFFFKDNQQHCLRCYKKYCDVTCLYCGQLILDDNSCVSPSEGNKRYHTHCAFCSVCGGHFKQGQEMMTEGDEIWHPKCSTLRKSIRQMENFITGTSEPRASSSSALSPKGPRPVSIHLGFSPSEKKSPLDLFDSISSNSDSKLNDHSDLAELKSKLKLPLYEGEHQKSLQSEKYYTQASFIPKESNKRQITSPIHNSRSSLSPLAVSNQYAFRQDNRSPLSSGTACTNGGSTDASFGASNVFLNRLNQAKYDQTSAGATRGRNLRPMYSNRRKISSSRHVALEPTIEESELEHELNPGEEAVAEKVYQNGDHEDTSSSKSSQDDNRSNESSMSSTDFNILEHRQKRSPLTPEKQQSNASSPYYLPYAQLRTRNAKLPPGVDRKNLERHLADKEFLLVFRCTKFDFYKQPKWRRDAMKRQFELF